MNTRPGELHVGVDARCLNTNHVRGIGKYVADLVSELRDAPELRFTVFGDRPELPMRLPDTAARSSIETFDVRGYRFRAWEQLALPRRAIAARVDVLFCTASTLPAWQPVPTVVTVHDTLLWNEPTAGRYEHWYLHRLVPTALRRSAAIITISESSRRDIVRRWPWLEHKIRVISHGLERRWIDPGNSLLPDWLQSNTAQSYIIYVGGSLARKRFEWATQVYGALPAPRPRLVAIGFRPEEAVRASAELPGALRDDVWFAPFIDEALMPTLFKGARAVLYPTLYEGFGFPALEAQAVGTPLLCSAVGSVAELVGPDVSPLPAQDLKAWQRALQDAMTASRAGISPQTRAWLSRYSWASSAHAHRSVWHSVARGPTRLQHAP